MDQFSKGRKIHPDFENPIDNIIINICEKLIKICQKYNITPNDITITRIIFGIFIIYKFKYSCNLYIPVFGTLIFYFLDCLDGNLARTTNQVTVLGDYLDHFADIGYFGMVIIIMINKSYPNKYIILVTISIFMYLSFIHLGLQQKKYNSKNNELLDNLNIFHTLKEENIVWTKYVGLGTFISMIVFSIYYIQSFC
uniref:CDP-alcohol phosphatidyltransferase n=1 Tax=viral metagenome TaxID=1070528 RepID=A0A6C0DAF1_9ZZZZ